MAQMTNEFEIGYHKMGPMNAQDRKTVSIQERHALLIQILLPNFEYLCLIAREKFVLQMGSMIAR